MYLLSRRSLNSCIKLRYTTFSSENIMGRPLTRDVGVGRWIIWNLKNDDVKDIEISHGRCPTLPVLSTVVELQFRKKNP